MIIYKRLFFLFFLAIFVFSCKSKNGKVKITNSSRYDLGHPFVIKLSDQIAEISGIAFYEKDTSVFAIKDEDGILYKIDLTQKMSMRKWQFDKKRDFEDIVLKDSIFYVLISNGNIETIQFGKNDSIITTKSEFPDAGKTVNEFESLFYDDSLHRFILLCKDCEDDNKSIVSAWGYDTATKVYTPSIFTIDAQAIAAKLNLEKIKFKPSGAAINPVTNELYIISAINNLLVVTDRRGKFKELYTLDPAVYKQPEGIAFTPSGDMIISNEASDIGLANILIIKNKKKGP